MKTFLVSACMALSFVSEAQIGIKRFYDIKGAEVDSVKAFYFEVVDRIEKETWLFSSYYIQSGSLRSRDELSESNELKLRSHFYPNGALKGKGYFQFSVPEGAYEAYYPDGRKQGEFIFYSPNPRDGNDSKVEIINYWDALGNKLVADRQGLCRCDLYPFSDESIIESGQVIDGFKEGSWEGLSKIEESIFKETYKKGILTAGTLTYNAQSFNYTRLENMASPVGGLRTFYQHVSNVMSYPRKARRAGVQGKVFVEFVVEKDGSLSEVKVVKGISDECNLEALEAVKSSPKWNSGLQRGRAVKQRMVLPITFKLS